MMPFWGGAKQLKAIEESLPGPGTSYPVWHWSSVDVANNFTNTGGKMDLNIDYS